VCWLDDEQRPAVKVLAEAPLEQVLAAVRTGAPVRIGEPTAVPA
jgi:hypothetical protein